MHRFFLLPILLFFSAQIVYPFCFSFLLKFSTHFAFLFCSNFLPILLPIAPFLSHPFCFSSSHVEIISGVQYLERSTWHCGRTWHWDAFSGPPKSTMPILLNLLYLTAHFASKLLLLSSPY